MRYGLQVTYLISKELDTVNNYLHNCRFLNECFESTTHFNHIFCTACLYNSTPHTTLRHSMRRRDNRLRHRLYVTDYTGLLLTYGLATRHACYAPATRRLLARYSPSIYMCGSPKTRRYLLNKSSNTIIWRLNIRQVKKYLYVEVESPRQVVNQ